MPEKLPGGPITMSELQQAVEVLTRHVDEHGKILKQVTPGLASRVDVLENKVDTMLNVILELRTFKQEQKSRDESLRDWLQAWAGRMELDVRKLHRTESLSETVIVLDGNGA